MPITHVNAKGKTYYLHQGTTKTGKPKYHFAMKSEGTLADTDRRFSPHHEGVTPLQIAIN
jgi:hypothetical protein